MAEKEQPPVIDKLVDAYEHMLERIHHTFERAEQETIPAFRELLHKTRDNMVELGELTREEAHKVAEYVERDIEDAARYIAETSADLKSWWRFDLDLIEQRMLDIFSRVADQTSTSYATWRNRRAGRIRITPARSPGPAPSSAPPAGPKPTCTEPAPSRPAPSVTPPTSNARPRPRAQASTPARKYR